MTISAPRCFSRSTPTSPFDRFLRSDSDGGIAGRPIHLVELGAEDEVLKGREEFTFTESALSIEKLVGQLVHNAGVGD